MRGLWPFCSNGLCGGLTESACGKRRDDLSTQRETFDGDFPIFIKSQKNAREQHPGRFS